MGENKEKDNWDKADVIGKVFSGVLLGILTLVISCSANKVADSFKKGELVQSLISDLSQNGDNVRKDLALIALNRTIYDQDPKLVIEMAEHIFKSGRAMPQDSLEQNIAYIIIKERSPDVASKLSQWVLEKIKDDSLGRSALRSQLDTSMLVNIEATSQAQKASIVFNKIVYIQFQGNLKRELMKDLAEHLNKEGYPAPGVERVPGNYVNMVRYFHEEDRQLAESVVKEVSQYLTNKGLPINFKVTNLSSSKFNTQKGHIEVWINRG